MERKTTITVATEENQRTMSHILEAEFRRKETTEASMNSGNYSDEGSYDDLYWDYNDYGDFCPGPE